MSNPKFTTPSARSSRDWASLEDAFPSDAPAATPPGDGDGTIVRGGGGGSGLVKSFSGLALGKSVCILPTNSTYKTLCCARVGASGNVYCFMEMDKCTTESHAKQRIKEGAQFFKAGIYVRKASASNSESIQAFGDPIGDILLLQNHEEAIVSCLERKPSEWSTLFNDWARSSSQLEHEELRDLKAKARAIQTPAKRDNTLFSVDQFLSADDETYEEGYILEMEVGLQGLMSSEGTDQMGQVLTKAGEEPPLQKFLKSLASRSNVLRAAIEQLGNEVSMNRTWNEETIRSSAERLTDLELALGKATEDEAIGASVWGSIKALGSRVSSITPASVINNLTSQVEDHEEELKDTYRGIQNFIANAERKTKQITRRLDIVEMEGTIDKEMEEEDVKEKVRMLTTQVEELLKLRREDALRLESLEAKSSNGLTSFQLGDTYTARGPGDVKAYLLSIGGGHYDVGGFCDVYNVLIRIQAKIEGAGEVGDFLKRKKDAKSVELSENEAMVVYSFLGEAPPIFGGDKSEKSDIQLLSAYTKWRIKGKQSGLGYEIQNKLKGVEREVKQLIQLSFRKCPELALLARSILSTSLEFIHKLVEWIDSTYEVLVEGGNTPQDVWSLITKVTRALFEEGMAPFRTTPTGTTFESPSEQSAVLLWGVLRTHLATESMLEGDLRDHAVVTGNYAKWLVNNSGKKDALVIKKELDKWVHRLSKIEDDMVTKRALTAVEKIAEAAKKVADRALVKASG